MRIRLSRRDTPLLLLLTLPAMVAATELRFPLRASPVGHYLVDASGALHPAAPGQPGERRWPEELEREHQERARHIIAAQLKVKVAAGGKTFTCAVSEMGEVTVEER